MSRNKRICWLEHVLCREKNSLVFQALNNTTRGRRPQLLWKDQVDNDLHIRRGYHRDTEDRNSLRAIKNEIKNCLGFKVS